MAIRVSHSPTSLSPAQVKNINFNSTSCLDMGKACNVPHKPGLRHKIARAAVCGMMKKLGRATARDVWLGPDGQRLVLDANQSRVLFMLVGSNVKKAKGVVYAQSGVGFAGDALGEVAAMVYKKTAPLVPIIMAEYYFLTGVVSCVSGTAFLVILGADTMQFFVQNKKKLPKWLHAFEVTLSVRAVLKQYAPVLYEKVVDASLSAAWKGVKVAVAIEGPSVGKKLPGSVIQDEKIVSKGLGVLVGKLGKNLMATRLSVLRIVWTILFTVATNAAKGIPGAVQKVAIDRKKSAQNIIDALKKAKVNLSQDEAIKIIQEVENNADVLKRAFATLKDAYDQIPQ